MRTRASVWLNELIEGTARSFSFRASARRAATGTGTGTSSVRGGPADFNRRVMEAHRLQAAGMTRIEIARTVGLAQDMVTLALHTAPRAAVDLEESAARGTFFRILETQMDAGESASLSA
jgi:hypothetical protein